MKPHPKPGSDYFRLLEGLFQAIKSKDWETPLAALCDWLNEHEFPDLLEIYHALGHWLQCPHFPNEYLLTHILHYLDLRDVHERWILYNGEDDYYEKIQEIHTQENVGYFGNNPIFNLTLEVSFRVTPVWFNSFLNSMLFNYHETQYKIRFVITLP